MTFFEDGQLVVRGILDEAELDRLNNSLKHLSNLLWEDKEPIDGSNVAYIEEIVHRHPQILEVINRNTLMYGVFNDSDEAITYRILNLYFYGRWCYDIGRKINEFQNEQSSN